MEIEAKPGTAPACKVNSFPSFRDNGWCYVIATIEKREPLQDAVVFFFDEAKRPGASRHQQRFVVAQTQHASEAKQAVGPTISPR